ncbi:ABC transporter substrate-binding protein [Ketogulonicigenium vulgare]|uniref:Probable sugar-binding periplasmic protein n=1 Tax=Ketogulonicigenium vulgare (strain WSH-001) TaxID=759362 RepID=F9YB83_KETVW|nr:ABC transporter substrate-binding protein [Ketogulonicigenium vulgare]ADO44111.1 extracellular solute-binding protein family 1 [Ketogulonicigenium vulgare Y25]AEM42635.1 Sugar ABC transporter [Ketogulonicigenium vulgare WSH-001]ALJ82441.1 sugar ABC transporter [Ketogulonicigenium vulgare]ANW35229.1 sugar ABC transporter [Ketogulonicigenium vulgare]AOZ53337.1 extracellular solute-binding protein family 1 [Ketogulonicigenium vulgare]
MKTNTLLIAASALALSASLARAQDLPAEVFTSWTSGGEALAVEAIRTEFEARGGTWETASIAGFENANAAFQNRVIAGDPPTVRQSVLGLDAAELVESGLANSLQSVADAQNWAGVMAPSVLDSISYNGEIFLAPVGIHGESWMFYSMPVFEANGITAAPTTWDEFFAAMDTLQAAGITPIAWGGQAWQEAKVFNMVLLSQVGNEDFLKIFQEGDEAVLTSDAIVTALEIFGRLRDYVDAGAAGRNWNDATNMVIQGQAGVQFMGDWAKGEFANAGLIAGQDYGCALAPASTGMLFVADGFLMMKTGDAAQDAAQLLMAEVATDPAVQVAFAQAKGSIPVRTDVDTSALDVCAQQAMTMMNDGLFVPEHAITVTPDMVGQFTDFVGEYFADPSYDAASAAEDLADIFRR